MMLGVRRPGVTVAVQLLERKGLIERKRGSIVIIDRKALQKLSNGTYAPAAQAGAASGALAWLNARSASWES